MDLGLLSQPVAIQIGLGAGYAAYTLAYVGIRNHHNVTDVLFKTLLFSLFSALVFTAFETSLERWALIVIAVALPITIAVAWRLLLIQRYYKFLGWLGYYTDDSPSAWHSLSHDESHYFSQVAVLTTDDEWLECEDLEQFKNSPSGPAVFGADGDIAIYVTHRRVRGEVQSPQNTIVDPKFGDRMTYIPKEQIKRVSFRRKRAN